MKYYLRFIAQVMQRFNLFFHLLSFSFSLFCVLYFSSNVCISQKARGS